jgi:hypothetical protein
MRRIAIIAIALVAIWLAVLVALGVIVGRDQPARISARLGESMQGSASVGAVDLALVRGRLSIDELRVRRDDAVGTLALDVPELRCELAPLGGALFDRECTELSVRGVRLEISSLDVLHPRHPQRAPIRAGRVSIADSSVALAVPAIGNVALRIDRATAGATVLRTPLSWIFALDGLDATIELPAGLALHLTYAGGMLGASGALFGSAPVVVPVELPHPTGDAHDETRALVELGEDVAERLVARRAADWLQR